MKKIFLLVTISVLFVTGCSLTKNDKAETSTGSQIHESPSDANTQANTETTQENGSWDVVTPIVYIDPNCTIQYCNKELITSMINQEILDSTWVEIQFEELWTGKWEEFKALWLVWSPVLEIWQTTLTSLIKNNPTLQPYIKSKDNKWIIQLYVWIPWEENECNDQIDNNNDGKIDLEDETCSNITILYDSKCTDSEVCDITKLSGMVQQQLFPVWYLLDTIDYSSWGKETYDKIVEIAWKNINLPTILSNKINDEKMIESMKTQWMLVELSGMDFKYVLNIIPTQWDPIKWINEVPVAPTKTPIEESPTEPTKE